MERQAWKHMFFFLSKQLTSMEFKNFSLVSKALVSHSAVWTISSIPMALNYIQPNVCSVLGECVCTHLCKKYNPLNMHLHKHTHTHNTASLAASLTLYYLTPALNSLCAPAVLVFCPSQATSTLPPLGCHTLNSMSQLLLPLPFLVQCSSHHLWEACSSQPNRRGQSLPVSLRSGSCPFYSLYSTTFCLKWSIFCSLSVSLIRKPFPWE